MNRDHDKRTLKDEEEIEIHSSLGIAVLLSVLLRNTDSPTHNFGDFEGQLEATIALGQRLENGGVPKGGAFKAIAEEIRDFHQTNPDLFKTAHLAIAALLTQLPDLDEWGPCRYVSHDTLTTLVKLAN